MVEKVFHNKLTQLAPHNQAEVQTHSILRPFNPKAAAGGGGGEQEGVEKGGGLDRGREEGGESKKRDRNGVRWRQGSATEDNGRNAMAAFEEYSSRQDVVDVDALD